MTTYKYMDRKRPQIIGSRFQLVGRANIFCCTEAYLELSGTLPCVRGVDADGRQTCARIADVEWIEQ